MVGYQRIVSTIRGRLPLTITPEGNASPQEDWRVIRAAFLARMARTSEALSSLVPMGARLDGMDLVRNLLEHVVCLAWVAADKESRLDVWLKRDYQGRIKFDEAVRQRLASGAEPRWDEQRLPAADRAHYERHVKRVEATLPRMREMCREADTHWMPRYPAGLANHRRLSFLSDYDYIYDSYSWMAHPRLTGLQAFWDFQPQWTVVHAAETGDPAHDPLHMGQLVAGHGLLIAALATGSPPVDEAIDVLVSNADLASHVRQGKVVTEELSPGRFELRRA